MYRTYLKPALPHLCAIIVFIAISVAYFSPEIFENKTILGHDSRQGTGQEITDMGLKRVKPFDGQIPCFRVCRLIKSPLLTKAALS